MADQFDDKVTLITGSGRGIGRAIALHFAQNGSDIVVNFFRNRETAEETAAEIRDLGRRALVVKANIGDLDDLSKLYEQIETEFGNLNFPNSQCRIRL